MSSSRPIHPNVQLMSYWCAAWHDAPLPLRGRAIDPTQHTGPLGRPQHCAKCGSPDIQPFDATDDSGTGWRQLYYQLHCPACGAYSVFHYDD